MTLPFFTSLYLVVKVWSN